MTTTNSALLTLLAEANAATDNERIRLITEHAYQQLIDAEATAVIGAGRYERTDERVALRNGTRAKTLSTTAGDLHLTIPAPAPAPSTPPCWNDAAASTGPCSR